MTAEQLSPSEPIGAPGWEPAALVDDLSFLDASGEPAEIPDVPRRVSEVI